MRAVFLTALAALAAFAVGLAGTYFVLPLAAPGIIEAARPPADSLAAAPALLAADPLDDDYDGPAIGGEEAGALLDSLSALHARLQDAERRIPLLLEQIRVLEEQVGGTHAQRTRVSELASTLTKLEERELGRLLTQLDHEVLATLYAEASTRDRTRLLAALSPARAAVLVRRAAGMPPAAPAPIRYGDDDDDAAFPPAPAL